MSNSLENLLIVLFVPWIGLVLGFLLRGLLWLKRRILSVEKNYLNN